MDASRPSHAHAKFKLGSQAFVLLSTYWGRNPSFTMDASLHDDEVVADSEDEGNSFGLLLNPDGMPN